jgi:hypothetical protein
MPAGSECDCRSRPGAGCGRGKISDQARAERTEKDETLKQKVKRVLKHIIGYKIAVGCPAVIELTHKACTETGKNRDAAGSKCVTANLSCRISDVN